MPTSLPLPQFPSVTWTSFQVLFSPAITIAILAALESLLSSVVADGMTGTRHRSNMELVAQGAGNIASAIFGGIPATGAIARTATNIKSGGKTPIAAIRMRPRHVERFDATHGTEQVLGRVSIEAVGPKRVAAAKQFKSIGRDHEVQVTGLAAYRTVALRHSQLLGRDHLESNLSTMTTSAMPNHWTSCPV